jgi:Bacterial protein of unknown function (DUF903)
MYPPVRTVLALAILGSLCACSTPKYVIGTNDGTLIQANGEPKLNKNTGMYEYEDMSGHDASIKQDRVTQILKQ